MSKGGDRAEETPQQRAQVEFAVNQLADYKKRWLPVQQRLATAVQEMGKEGSSARKAAAGKANVDSAINFEKAQGAVQKMLTAGGAAPGSGKFDLGVTGVETDKAASRGLGVTIADQQVDDAYLSGLSALAATGKGQRAQVADSLGRQAQQSARQAQADAEASVQQHAAQAGLAGQFAGYGLQSAFGAQPKPQAPGMGTTVLGAQADGFTTNPQFGH